MRLPPYAETSWTHTKREATRTTRTMTVGRVYVFCVVAVAMIAISELPATANAFIDPLTQLFTKKMMLKHGLFPVHTPASQSVIYGGQFVQQQPHPRPSPPTTTYFSYGPPTSYPAYGPPSYPSYGPPSYSGYESAPVIKPDPPAGCLPGSNPSPQVDYSQYAVHSGHGYGSYGNGGYGK